jgi:hypothetical protein
VNRLLSVIVFMLSIGALPSACVDTSALDYVPPATEAGIGTVPACVECITSQNGPCWAQYEPCLQNSLCEVVLQCLIDRACMMLPVPVDRVTCGLPCASEHGLVNANDPAIQKLAELNICALQNCTEQCDAQ